MRYKCQKDLQEHEIIFGVDFAVLDIIWRFDMQKRINNKTKVSQKRYSQANMLTQQKLAASPDISHDSHPLENITCKIGDNACAAKHVSVIQQSGLFHPMNENQKVQSLLRLQRQYGNRFVQRVIAQHAIQTKLAVSQPGDIYEKEADRVTEQVMQMSEPQIQRQPEEEEEEMLQPKSLEEEEEELQPEELPRQSSEFNPNAEIHINTDDAYEKEADRVADEVIQKEIENPFVGRYRSEFDTSLMNKPISIQRRLNCAEPQTLNSILGKSSGQPLDRQVRHDMESRFGYSFENVRIHNDSEAHRLSRSFNAHAFAAGDDIYFGHNEYNPASRDGKRLIAHELTHVVQQGYAKANNSTSEGSIQRAEAEESNQEAEEKQREFERQKEEARREFGVQRSGGEVIQRMAMDSKTAAPALQKMNILRQALPSIQRNNDDECGSPRLTQRGKYLVDLDRESWRAYVYAHATARATNNRLTVNVWARAGVYYVIWASFGELDFTANVDVECNKVGESCQISANEVGGSVFQSTDSPASGAISIQTENRANNTVLAMTPRVGAAVEAGGGAGAGVGPYSVGVTFPGGGMSTTKSHGTFLWSCEQPTVS
jgi:hypothetical protein